MQSGDFSLTPYIPFSTVVTHTQSFCLYQLLPSTPTHLLTAAACPLLRCPCYTSAFGT